MEEEKNPDATYFKGKADFRNMWIRGPPYSERVSGLGNRGFIDIEDLTYEVNILDEDGKDVIKEYPVTLSEKSIKDFMGILGVDDWKDDYIPFIKKRMMEAFGKEPKEVTKQGERVYSSDDMDFYMVLGLTKRIIGLNVEK